MTTVLDRPSRVEARRVSRNRSRRTNALVIAGFVVLGLLAFWPVLPGMRTQVFSVDGDFRLTVWFLGWVPHALLHGLNPFYSDALFAPSGINLAQNTEGPLLGVLMMPITMLFGPIVSGNIVLVLAMPISATSAFLVFRSWHVALWPSALGGLMYGFSPYAIGQSVGHPVLVFLPLPPLIAWLLVRIVTGRGRPLQNGGVLGLLIAAQYLISVEVLTTTAVFAVLALLAAALRHPGRLGALVSRMWMPSLCAVLVAGALLSYPIWMLLAGPGHATLSTIGNATGNSAQYHVDLLDPVVSGPLEHVAVGSSSLRARLLVGTNPTESSGYLGVALLALVVLLGWRSRRSERMQLVVVLFVLAAVFTLGDELYVGGHLTGIPLPFKLLTRLPLLGDLLASRLTFEEDAFLAAILAFGFDDLRQAGTGSARPSPAPTAALAMAGTLLFVGLFMLWPNWPYTRLPARVLPAAAKAALPAGNPLAYTFPYDTEFKTTVTLWQADAGFAFRQFGGYAVHRGAGGVASVFPDVLVPGVLQQFFAAQEKVLDYGPALPLTPTLVSQTRQLAVQYGVHAAIVDTAAAGSGPVVQLMDQAFGRPRYSAGGFSIWAF